MARWVASPDLSGVLWFLPKNACGFCPCTFFAFLHYVHIAHIMAFERILVHSRLHLHFLHFARVCIWLHLVAFAFFAFCACLHLVAFAFFAFCACLHLVCILRVIAFRCIMHSVGNCISAAYAFSAFFAFGGKLHLVAWIH